MENFILICFFASAIIQIIFSLFFYLRLLFYKKKAASTDLSPAISVIIAAKNEGDNLLKFLPKILEQNYPEFEVIVVNDCSLDNSLEILNQFKIKYKHLRVLNILPKENKQGKKHALSKGIQIAKNEILAFTDADCFPVSESWLSAIAGAYSNGIEIVLGYGAYQHKPSFLNTFIRYETIFTALQYLSFANTGVPYMGVGRNLSYKKSLWVKQNGFSAHAHILSGDDDLFINTVANKQNTAIIICPESKTLSVPNTTIKALIKQKQRHLEAGGSYKNLHKFLLGTDYFTRLGFYTFSILILALYPASKFVIIIILLREFMLLFIVYFSIKKFNEKSFLLLILIFDFLSPVINILIVLKSHLFGRKIKWK